MIGKVVTGIPASKNRQDFMKYDKETNSSRQIDVTHQIKKKYSNQLKKELKVLNYYIILE